MFSAEDFKLTIGSIMKWHNIVESKDSEDRGEENCPLCKRFLVGSTCDGSTCNDCPVKEKTKVDLCEDTPYKDWVAHHVLAHSNNGVMLVYYKRHEGCYECLELATKERDFLISILPVDEQLKIKIKLKIQEV